MELLLALFFFFSLLFGRRFAQSKRGRQDVKSGNEEIDSICLCVSLSGRKRARKEGIETCAWLEIKSEALDECEGVSLLPVCFVSALLLSDALFSAARRHRVTYHPLRRRPAEPSLLL